METLNSRLTIKMNFLLSHKKEKINNNIVDTVKEYESFFSTSDRYLMLNIYFIKKKN